MGLLVVAGWFAFWAHASLSDVKTSGGSQYRKMPAGLARRSQLWPAAIALFERYPLTGNGAGDFSLLLPTVGLFNVQTQAGSLWLGR